MKMKLWDRLILRLGALLTLLTGAVAIAAGVLLCGATVTGAKWWPQGNLASLVLIVAGAVTVLFSLNNMALPRRYNPRRRAFVIQPTEHGELRIAVSAIENLILRCVETHKEVKVLSMQIANRRGGVKVNLRVAVSSNVSIPHAVDQLQTQIKRYLAASSGIEVREISVSVERATGDENALSAEALPVAVAESDAGEKVSVHQRVFGRDTTKTVAEQVAEAEAILPPEEVKAEETAAAEEKIEETVEETPEVQETAAEEAAQAAAEEEKADETEAQA